jgi:RNA polymerase sigma-70 factor (ECF subfamily)
MAQRHDLRLHLLVLRCQAGDERAFATLMEEFGPHIHRYLTGLVGADAEDVQQEVWLTVFRSLVTLTNPGAFRTWLYRTTRHRAIDHLRRQRRERELFVDSETERELVRSSDVDPLPDIDAADLDTLLAKLSVAHREVILLRFRDGLQYAEIALVIGCPVGTVKTRVHHAKLRLHQLLTRGEP